MPLTSPLSMDPPCFPRRKKTAAERRAQRQRSEARFLQRALSGLNDVHLHRGGTLTRFGFALRQALSHLSSCDEVLPSCFEGPSTPYVVPPTLDAGAAQFHGFPADESFTASALVNDAEDHFFKGRSSSYGGGVDARGECSSVSAQLQEVPCSTVIGSGDDPNLMIPPQHLDLTEVTHDCQHGSVQIPDASQTVFPLSGKRVMSHCFLELPDVRNGGAASRCALMAGRPFFYMILRGLSFVQSELAAASEAPAGENKPCHDANRVVDSVRTTDVSMTLGCSTPFSERASLRSDHVHDANGGVKYDCAQQ